jgi:hypothetical protein
MAFFVCSEKNMFHDLLLGEATHYHWRPDVAVRFWFYRLSVEGAQDIEEADRVSSNRSGARIVSQELSKPVLAMMTCWTRKANESRLALLRAPQSRRLAGCGKGVCCERTAMMPCLGDVRQEHDIAGQ